MKTTFSATLLVLLLAGCKPPEAPPPPPDATAPAPAAPDATPSVDPSAPAPTDPTTTPAAPAQPAPTAPAPTEPSPAPKPTAANAPDVATMSRAIPSAKMSVAVDLKYSFDGTPAAGQPVTLHLAAIPRVAGNNFAVSVKQAPGIQVSQTALSAQKVEAQGVYRQQYALTRTSASASGVRVLVTMDMPEGTAFGFFTVPFDAGTTVGKTDIVKQR